MLDHLCLEQSYRLRFCKVLWTCVPILTPQSIQVCWGRNEGIGELQRCQCIRVSLGGQATNANKTADKEKNVEGWG